MGSISFEDLPAPLSEEDLSAWLTEVARIHNKRIGTLSYSFVDDTRILEINKTFLRHDYYTDIITFDYVKRGVLNGEIFISLDTVKSNASKLSIKVEEELMRVMAHGILHLIGFEDKSADQQEVMREKENFSLLLRSEKLKRLSFT